MFYRQTCVKRYTTIYNCIVLHGIALPIFIGKLIELIEFTHACITRFRKIIPTNLPFLLNCLHTVLMFFFSTTLYTEKESLLHHTVA